MKKTLLGFIIILLSIFSFAQKKENFSIKDSLLKISNSKVPYEQVLTFIHSSEHYIFSKGDSALILLAEAENIAKANKIDFLLPAISHLLSEVESRVTGNYPRALFHSFEQLKYALKNIEEGRAYDLNFITATSLDWAYYNIAMSYAFLGNKEKAIEYMDKVDIQFLQILDYPDYLKKLSLDTTTIISVYSTNAQFYLLVNDLIKAKWYNDKAIMLNEKLSDSVKRCQPYTVKADILSIQTNYSEAIKTYEISIPYAIRSGFYKYVLEANYGIAISYYKMNEIDSAMKYANQVVLMSGEYTYTEGVLKANQLLYQIWKQKGNKDSTLFFLENAYGLREQYFNNIKRYGAKYQALEEELIRNNLAEQGDKQKNKLIITVIVLFSIGLLVYFITGRQKRKNK